MFPNSIISAVKSSKALPSTSIELLQSTVLRDAYMSHGTQAEETALDLFEVISDSGDKNVFTFCFHETVMFIMQSYLSLFYHQQ